MALIDKIRGKQAEEQSAFINIPSDEVIEKTFNNNRDTSTMNITNTTDGLCDPPAEKILVEYFSHDNTFRELVDNTVVVKDGRIRVMNSNRLPGKLYEHDQLILKDGIVTHEWRELTQNDLTAYYCAYLGQVIYGVNQKVVYNLDTECLETIDKDMQAEFVNYDCRTKEFTKGSNRQKPITKEDAKYVRITNLGDFIFTGGRHTDGIEYNPNQIEIQIWYKESSKEDDSEEYHRVLTKEQVTQLLTGNNDIPRGTAYLVDSENMGLSWLELIEKMGPNDTVYVFFTNSPNSPKISYNDLALIMGCSALGEGKKNVEFVTCMSGKNAVDMQLCVMYGYLIAKNKYKNIEILSHDNAFEFGINLGNKLMDVEMQNAL